MYSYNISLIWTWKKPYFISFTFNFLYIFFIFSDSAFDEIYHEATDNRRILRKLTSAHDLQAEWDAINALLENHNNEDDKNLAENILRDGHCHEAVMVNIFSVHNIFHVLLMYLLPVYLIYIYLFLYIYV